MILLEFTKSRFGYNPTNLRSNSHKPVLVECEKCGIIRSVSYQTYQSSKSGMCSICSVSKYDPLLRSDEYKQRAKERVLRNIHSVRATRNTYKEKNNKKLAIYQKVYYKKYYTMPDVIARERIRRREYQKIRRSTDEKYRLVHNLRVNLRCALNQTTTRDEHHGCLRLLSYHPSEFVQHINNLLSEYHYQCPCCNTSLYNGNFEIDHITPISTAVTTTDVLFLFRLSNLDVLCPSCNHSKSDSVYESIVAV